MAANKITIEGLANTGKTSLLKSLDADVLVISYDDKPYPFKQPHRNIVDFENMEDLLSQVDEAIVAYEERFDELPKYVAFDSVSTIATAIEAKKEESISDGFKAWAAISKEMNAFVKYVNNLLSEHNISVILTSHVVWDEKLGKMKELSKGNFGKKGGFLSTVDYSIYIERIGNKYIINHKGKDMARSLLDDIADKVEAKDFSLKEYLETIESQQSDVGTFSL